MSFGPPALRPLSSCARAPSAGKPHLTGTVRFRTPFSNVILDALRSCGFKEGEHWNPPSETDWDIFWSDRSWLHENLSKMHLNSHQRINHFRNHYELTRKDLMMKNLKKMRRLVHRTNPEDDKKWRFFPTTFSLPNDYLLFVEAFKKAPGSCWIMKPVGKSQGKGIFLFRKLNEINEWRTKYSWNPDLPRAEKYIVQQYIANPLLVGGKKFDLRLYALVTNYQPLTVYLFRDGFARFTSSRFSMDTGAIGDNCVHLTNVAIQKHNTEFVADTGGKWSLKELKQYLFAKFGRPRVNRLFTAIQHIIVRSLVAVQNVIINDRNSFELYGYDVLIDDALVPWLIEVNASPSMTANTATDYALKLALLRDTFAIIDMEKHLTGEERHVGGFDLVHFDGVDLQGAEAASHPHPSFVYDLAQRACPPSSFVKDEMKAVGEEGAGNGFLLPGGTPQGVFDSLPSEVCASMKKAEAASFLGCHYDSDKEVSSLLLEVRQWKQLKARQTVESDREGRKGRRRRRSKNVS